MSPVVIAGVAGQAARLRVGDAWTLPMVEFSPKNKTAEVTCLIMTEGGLSHAKQLVTGVLEAGQRAVVVDILFTGECRWTPTTAPWKQAQLISTVGGRVLGIQAAQVNAVVDHLRQRHPDNAIHVVTQGCGTSLAAVTAAALEPGKVRQIKMTEAFGSLKDLIRESRTYSQYPSVYCFGLLELVDMGVLAALASPTRIHRVIIFDTQKSERER